MVGVGSHLRIGELLMDAGILSQEQIAEAVSIAQHERLPVGRALVMCGFLSEDVLQAALEAQSRYRDRLLTRQECLNALETVRQDGVAFDDALERLGCHENKAVATNRLGELLAAAGLLAESEIDEYVEKSRHIGLPLGRLLATIGLVPESLVMVALTVQLLIREGKATRAQGIDALKAACSRQIPVKQYLTQAAAESAGSISIRLGELLVTASFINEHQLIDCLEESLLKEQQLGQTLLNNELISQDELHSALMLQEMVANGQLKPTRACEALAMVRKDSLSLSEAITQAGTLERENGKTMALYTFIGLAGIVSRADLESSQALGEQDNATLLRKLVDANLLTESLFRDCQRLHALMSEGMVTLERAIVVLKNCQSTGRSAKVSLQDFGWRAP